MQMKKIEWDDLACSIPQEFADRGLDLIDGGAPWLYVAGNDDLMLTVCESWFCEKTDQWLACDIALKVEDLFKKLCKTASDCGTTEEYAEEKQRVISGLKKLIKSIESI